MRSFLIFIFISLAILVYALVNFYIFIKGWQALDGARREWRLAYAAAFIVLAGSFIAGRFLERAGSSIFTEILVWVGSFWLAVMLYGFLAAALSDLIMLTAGLLKVGTLKLLPTGAAWKLWTFIVTAGLILIITVAGFFNACKVRVKKLELGIPKKAGQLKQLKVTMASDIHLGTIIGNGRLGRLVEKINATDPDLVLLAGDIVDEDIGPVIRGDMGKKLKGIKARYGVIGITGNHEYIGGSKKAVDYLEAHGIKMLLDDKILIGDALWVVGRKDRSGARFEGSPRKQLKDILSGIDKDLPIILLDHQPFNLEEVESSNVDLQLSGHTHHGQLWPLNFITNRVYEKSWGYLKKGMTHFYVSSGAGTWGPPVRTGNHPEIVSIKINFSNQ
jgi:predicted MPP superfamily phosphohydrolase